MAAQFSHCMEYDRSERFLLDYETSGIPFMFIIKNKTITTIIFLSIEKLSENIFSECRVQRDPTLREMPVRDDDSGPNGELLSYRQNTYFIKNIKTSYYE